MKRFKSYLIEIGFPPGSRPPRERGAHYETPSEIIYHPLNKPGANPIEGPDVFKKQQEVELPNVDPKSTGLDIDKLRETIPDIASVSGGNIITHSEILAGHLSSLAFHEENPHITQGDSQKASVERNHLERARGYFQDRGYSSEQLEEFMKHERERRRILDEHDKIKTGDFIQWRDKRLEHIQNFYKNIEALMVKFHHENKRK